MEREATLPVELAARVDAHARRLPHHEPREQREHLEPLVLHEALRLRDVRKRVVYHHALQHKCTTCFLE